MWGHPRRGTEMQAGWDWVGRKGLGGGLFFSAYHSRAYGLASPPEVADERFHMNFFYIGPEFVVRTFFSDYWSAKAALGLGAFFSREKGTRQLSVGLRFGWLGRAFPVGIGVPSG